MATDVRVFISDSAIISALNTPGGAVFEWRDDIGEKITQQCRATSPVNHTQNAKHRGGIVGTYKAGWFWTAIGSNGHQVRALVYNESDHADIVEYGRRASFAKQRFSWENWKHSPPGSIQIVRKTRGREGKHVLSKAVALVMASEGLPVIV